jgi:hypothetical protein
MCAERPGTKLKLSPVKKSAAGTTSGSAAAGGRGATGMSGSTGGTANGRVGASGEPGAGEGGGPAAETGEGSGGSAGHAGRAGSGTGARDGTGGGAGESNGSGGGTGAVDGSGGTAGSDSAGGTTGSGDAGAAGDLGSSSGGRAAGGRAGQGGLGGAGASAGADAGGMAGAGGACLTKTNCCKADDPPCLDGCPSNAAYCCNLGAGARIACAPATDFESVVCINPCNGHSYGTAPCSSACLQPADPPCSDPTWDDVCLTGGFASCSDAAVGYRASCNAGEVAYYSYVSCTCDPDS